ncbi:MAG TPA: XRE family transcriptional regulator [Ktedonobacteraceae bacterium]|nr:XRE family transcriptional regulator [Ktedonobacteraceae bacterium]
MIGDRIRQARLIQGATQDEVIARLTSLGVKLSKAALSKFERNQCNPTASVLMNLASVLNVSASYFLQEPDVNVTWVAFRKTARLTTAQEERIQAFAKDRAEKQAWLQMKLYPDEETYFPRPISVQAERDAERAAEYLRQQWHLGEEPIKSVAQIFEDHGGVLIFWETDQGEFDGLSGWVNETIPIAVVNNGVSIERQRFNLAHELGHMIMFCDNLSEDEEEKLAQHFAAAFLVPAKVAIHELGAKRKNIDLGELALLKQKHGLSMRAWIKRAYELNIIDDTLYNNLLKLLKESDYSKQEPVEYIGEEEPRRMKQMTLRAFAERVISEEAALKLCPGCIRESEPQITLPPGRKYSARDLMKLSLEERNVILAEAARSAAEEYRTNEELNSFNAEDDIIEDY